MVLILKNINSIYGKASKRLMTHVKHRKRFMAYLNLQSLIDFESHWQYFQPIFANSKPKINVNFFNCYFYSRSKIQSQGYDKLQIRIRIRIVKVEPWYLHRVWLSSERWVERRSNFWVSASVSATFWWASNTLYLHDFPFLNSGRRNFLTLSSPIVFHM